MKFYLLAVSLLLPVYGFSQVSFDEKQQDLLGRGHLNIGVNVGGGYSSGLGTVSHITPRIQYFLLDGWSIAAEARSIKTESYFTYLGGGLSTRYYFLRSTHLALFGQLGAVYGLQRYTRVDPTNPYQLFGQRVNAWQTTAGLGVHYRLGNRWSIEATGERRQFQTAYQSPDYSGWQANIGINFRLK